MTRRRWTIRAAKMLLWLVPGTTLLGTSCTQEFRDGLIDAGVVFMTNTATEVLQALFPVADWVTAAQAAGTA